jgi:S1-C subfamily serine protease
MADVQQCLRCGREADWSEATCLGCGTTLTVDVRLLTIPPEARVRYELAKRLSTLPGLKVDLGAQLKTAAPLLAHGVTRALAAEVGRVLSRGGLEFEVLPCAASVRPSSSPDPRPRARTPALVPVLLVLLVGVAVALGLLALRTSPAAQDALRELATKSSETVRAVTAEPVSLKDAVQSVVSVRCGKSLGSGFFVSPHTVVTNHHVLCPEDERPRLVLANGTEASAAVVAGDEKHDLALLSTQVEGRPLQLADAASAELGSQVAIIGNPQGLDFTVHRGTLSFVGRATGGVGYLQIDGSINPGNSGGPVLDARGRVIGVVNARLRNADGIGFAVPANYLVAGPQPLWKDGPRSLLTEAWADFDRRTRDSEGAPLTSAKQPSVPTSFELLLVGASWLRFGRGATPQIQAVVVTTDAQPESRRWVLHLMNRDEPLCDLLRTSTVAWVRLESTDPNLDRALAQELVAHQLDRHLYVGVMVLEWSSCPGAWAHAPAELSLELPGASKPYDRTGIRRN